MQDYSPYKKPKPKQNKQNTHTQKKIKNKKTPKKENQKLKLCLKQINLNTAYPYQIFRQCLNTCASLYDCAFNEHLFKSFLNKSLCNSI